LKEENDKLENNNAQLTKTIKSMQAELDLLKSQINALRQQLKECQEAGK
jgi:prefoldin subunit 5